VCRPSTLEPSPTVNRRNILFIDDDTAFLETVSQLFLAWSHGTWKVHLAPTTAKALQLLQAQAVDLAVMDIQMPVMDGIQFLALLNRKCPTLRKVVMTGFGSDEYRAACLSQGAELFLEKPRTSEGYETVFATLNELASLQQQEGFRGVLRQVGLPDLIQMECLGRSSSVLEVSNGQVRGLIYIEHGAIVHAELGQIIGESAFNNLLCLRGGEFNLKPFSAPPQRSIIGQWEFLLMEAAHMRDELAELAGPAASAFPTTAAGAEPTVPSITGPLPPGRPDAPNAAAACEVTTSVDELVVCSGQSEVLYEWQCRDVEDRLKLLSQIAQKADHFGRLFALGRFDRMEALGEQGRFVAQIAPDLKLFLRCSRQPAAPGTAESHE
jgi:CheY-like chemotaxis protein